jgi:hypothetical protein
MTPVGQDPIECASRRHRVEGLKADRSRIIYRMEISGPAADSLGPEVGPQISADFPATLAALVQRAER